MVDFIIFAIILAYMYMGYRRSFEREFPRLVSIAGALIFGVVFYEVIASIINLTPLPDAIGGLATDDFIKRVSTAEIESGTVNQIFGSLTNAKNKYEIIGEFVVKFLSFMMLYGIGYIVSRKIFKRYKVFKKVKVARQISPVLGGVVGIFKGFLIAYMLVAVIVIAEPFIATTAIRDSFEANQIGRFMYEDNYIANVVAQYDFLTSDR